MAFIKLNLEKNDMKHKDNIFETGTRENYRFESNKGDLTISQLWKLDLLGGGKRVHNNVYLDDIHASLFKRYKELTSTQNSLSSIIKGEDSKESNPEAEKLANMIEIVERIAYVKNAETEFSEKERNRVAKLRRIRTIKARRIENRINIADDAELDKLERLLEAGEDVDIDKVFASKNKETPEPKWEPKVS